jgi:expansin (peptidoglycan-binding protein)
LASLDTSGACLGHCDAATPTTPVVSDTGGHGDVTTYGGVNNAKPSSGGACNYGETGITHYAAIQVNLLPGDLRGQWQGGKICGQCVEIKARTADGWKRTVARIVDKCPDGNCGIDLGGAPATELMGAQAGRYSGSWRFVSCVGETGVFDGPAALHVKGGSNAWWSLVQVRNPTAAVLGMRLRPATSLGAWDTLTWATEAENFFKVPTPILSDSTTPRVLEAWTRDGRVHSLSLMTRSLSRPDTNLAFDTLR